MTEKTKIRVRFAPSPTGYLHVGGARTALYNWLFARHNNGVFILRIEDTDIERSTSESEEGVLRDLRWLGLEWDEGPGKGGPHAPYNQSQRIEKYKKAALDLAANGLAYRCFCTDEELAAKRQAAEENHESLHYDGTCRNLSLEEISKRLNAGTPYAWRLKVPRKDYILNDLVRGRVEWKSETIGDFIILRSNGMPVYNFCVVVDDSDMEITHVIRAEEHLTNTHRQLILYEAMGKTPPEFAHVSLILGPDKSKLSKRHGATSIEQYAQEGYLPQGMANFLALLGWSEGNDREIYTLAELIEHFSLERINKSPAVFDQVKLKWVNGSHIRTMPIADIVRAALPFLEKAYPDDERMRDADFTLMLCDLLKNHLAVISDIVSESATILKGGEPENDEAREVIASPDAQTLLKTFTALIKPDSWTREAIGSAVKEAGKQCGLKGKKLFMPIRVALTGRCHGPDLAGIMEVIGYSDTVKRLG